MIKRCFPLWLLLAWAPTAFAFPPCPVSPVSLTALSADTSSNTAPWFESRYALLGNPDTIAEMDPWILSGDTPTDGGKCKDRLPVLEGNASSGVLQLNPSYAPNRAYGLLSLPETPFVMSDGMYVEYALSFTVDNAPLANTGDWFDAVQLDFHRSTSNDPAYDQQPVTAIYRMRKVQRSQEDFAAIEVIESRNTGTVSTGSRVTDRIVAVIPLSSGKKGSTAIKLSWGQHANGPFSAGPTAAGMTQLNIDSVLSVSGPNGVVYTTSLPAQWASSLAMGLLDYNVPKASAYSSNFRVVFDDVWLAAKAF